MIVMKRYHASYKCKRGKGDFMVSAKIFLKMLFVGFCLWNAAKLEARVSDPEEKFYSPSPIDEEFEDIAESQDSIIEDVEEDDDDDDDDEKDEAIACEDPLNNKKHLVQLPWYRRFFENWTPWSMGHRA